MFVIVLGYFLGGGFDYFLFSPRKLGKLSILTSIFFKWVETTNKFLLVQNLFFKEKRNLHRVSLVNAVRSFRSSRCLRWPISRGPTMLVVGWSTSDASGQIEMREVGRWWVWAKCMYWLGVVPSQVARMPVEFV